MESYGPRNKGLFFWINCNFGKGGPREKGDLDFSRSGLKGKIVYYCNRGGGSRNHCYNIKR